MGTLTGETPYLPEHCDHKLPTSCRLTASPKCCACQDLRPHAPLYTVYIDGVGLVQRGTRWERYCFFCKEFWKNRVAATEPRMLPEESRIPDIPDQTPFIQRWFEFHRGYRIVTRQDTGAQERSSVRCERPWRDADPGTLPVYNHAQKYLPLRWTRPNTNNTSTDSPSLVTTLDDLIAAADEEQNEITPPPQPHPAIESTSIDAPNHDHQALAEATERFNDAQRRHLLSQLRLQRAECELRSARTELGERQAEIDLTQRGMARAQSRIDRRLATERTTISASEANQRAAQRFARVFGTREEIERQGTEYVSPLASMFTRAWERYGVAEDVRSAERAVRTNPGFQPIVRERYEVTAPTNYAHDQLQLSVVPDAPFRTLDDEADNRPPPKTTAEMTISLVCRICFQQTADVAVLPCGHLVMCSYCADIWIPSRQNDDTQPRDRGAQCPLCRKRVKRKARIYTS